VVVRDNSFVFEPRGFFGFFFHTRLANSDIYATISIVNVVDATKLQNSYIRVRAHECMAIYIYSHAPVLDLTS